MTILVAADFDAAEWAAWWPALEAALPGERLVRDASDAAGAGPIDIALVANPPLGSLRGLGDVELVQSLWAGVDRLLDDPDLPAAATLVRLVDPRLAAAMAETALWAVLALQRGFFDYAAQQRRREWRPLVQRRADETGVAVLGLGQTGRATAARLVAGGYRVRGWSGSAVALDSVVAATGDAGLADTLAAADIVVNLLPLTAATRGLLDANRLGHLPRGAGLVNLARGGHVVEADLLAALDRGHLSHAVLDVFAVEPLPAGHRFWSHPRVTVLPHIAAQTDPRSAAEVVARNLAVWRAGGVPTGAVDRARGY